MTLEKPIYDLLKDEPFFAHFLLSCKITMNEADIPMAAVRVKRGVIEFFINPTWYATLGRQTQVAILKHEIMHVLLEHTGNRGGDGNRMAKNIAMDCAINQHIEHLPKDCVTLSSLETLCKRKLAAEECWEYYYEALKKTAAKDQNAAGHAKMSGSGDGDGEPSDVEEAINRAAVQSAAKKSLCAAAGNIPAALVNTITALTAQASLPWTQILRNFVANAQSITKYATRSRANRRFGLDQPGKRKEKKLILGVCVDSSGSVSDEAYAKFLHEISILSKSTDKIYLIHADCTVQHIDTIKDGKMKEGLKNTRHGSGGTAYTPAIEKCCELDCDAIIYFGDMDAADVPEDPRKPFLWVRVGQQEPPGKFGKVLDLN